MHACSSQLCWMCSRLAEVAYLCCHVVGWQSQYDTPLKHRVDLQIGTSACCSEKTLKPARPMRSCWLLPVSTMGFEIRVLTWTLIPEASNIGAWGLQCITGEGDNDCISANPSSPSTPDTVLLSTLNFVDLAGSESYQNNGPNARRQASSV